MNVETHSPEGVYKARREIKAIKETPAQQAPLVLKASRE
ncbi:MAG: hypothetical protein QOC99_1257 [Acidobacteriota bacterium]|jgi:hypothetical protein|nr:hypothetical protein [Acidobacteriota bacterium]